MLDSSEVHSNVHQGFHSEPLLFNVFVNVLKRALVYLELLLLADLKLFKRIAQTRKRQNRKNFMTSCLKLMN